MSIAQDDFDRWLGLDVEEYLKGHEPPSIQLAGATLLEKWCVNLVYERFETPSVILLKEAMSLTGHVTAHEGNRPRNRVVPRQTFRSL